MDIRPDDIEQTEFTTARRGFDKDEVRSYLMQVAAQVRELQEGTEQEAAFLPLGDTSDLSGEDRFGALGDRIANLLRDAHEASEQTRESASTDASAMRSEAQQVLDEAKAEADRIREEAALFRTQVEEEAVEIRNQAEIDGNARLDDRRVEIERQEADVEAEREKAMAELADARSQVQTLLEEARAQTEFIRLEAEEIIRAKVRANVDQAQRRIDMMRTTEQASKDRILTAQRELESALGRLSAEAVPEFPSDTEEAVYLEAKERVAELEGGEIPTDPDPTSNFDGDVIEVGESVDETPAGTEDSAGDFSEGGDVPFEDGASLESPADSAFGVTDEASDEEDGVHDSAMQEVVDVEEVSAAEAVSEADLAEADTSDEVRSDFSDELSEEAFADESQFVTAGVPIGEPTADDSGSESEDALARLVREAMQRAVDSARSPE